MKAWPEPLTAPLMLGPSLVILLSACSPDQSLGRGLPNMSLDASGLVADGIDIGRGGSCGNRVALDAGADLTEGLVAWYRCESGTGASGTVLSDASGHGNDATLHWSAGTSVGYAFLAGKIGNGLTLILASKGYVAMPAGLLANACEATIATWVYVNSDSNAWSRIWDFGNDTNAYMFLTRITNTDQLARFGITNTGGSHEELIVGQTPVPYRKWTHVAVVLGPSGGTLYFDGVVYGTNPSMVLRPADLGSTANNYIGRSQYSVDPYFDGSVDEFRIYTRALSPEEIRALAQAS
jgi:hypothetical protein